MNKKALHSFFRAKIKFLIFVFVSTSISQFSYATELSALSEEKLKQTILEIGEKISSLYVTEAEGNNIAESIRAHYIAGDYTGLDGVSVAKKITEHLYAASNDLHMYINYDPESASQSTKNTEHKQADDQPSDAELAIFKNRAQAANFGIQEFKWLHGKVAVISITQWEQLNWVVDKIDAIMQLAEGANAIIFDIRSNIGGSPEGARYIQGHFLEKVMPMIVFKNRQEKEPFIDSSPERVNGKKRIGMPMYILIDGNCASACEDFALTSRDAGLAILVGETTAGAGYMNTVIPIAEEFQMSVSIAGAFSAKTGDNWQTKGVSPDVEVAAPDALNKAYSMILENLAVNSQGPEEKQQLEQRNARIQADLNLSDKSLSSYSGNYGKIEIETAGRYLKLSAGHMTLYYQRLIGDMFIESIRSDNRIQFNRDDTGKIVSYNLLHIGAPTKTYNRQ